MLSVQDVKQSTDFPSTESLQAKRCVRCWDKHLTPAPADKVSAVGQRISGKIVCTRIGFGNKLRIARGNNEEVGVVVTLSPLCVLGLLGRGRHNHDASGLQRSWQHRTWHVWISGTYAQSPLPGPYMPSCSDSRKMKNFTSSQDRLGRPFEGHSFVTKDFFKGPVSRERNGATLPRANP
jgi:hypothetical protein